MCRDFLPNAFAAVYVVVLLEITIYTSGGSSAQHSEWASLQVHVGPYPVHQLHCARDAVKTDLEVYSKTHK